MARKRNIDKAFVEWTLVSLVIALVATVLYNAFSYAGIAPVASILYSFTIAIWILFTVCLFIVILLIIFKYLKGR